MSEGKEPANAHEVKLEDASENPVSGAPTCVTVGSLRDVLRGRTIEELLREADEADVKAKSTRDE